MPRILTECSRGSISEYPISICVGRGLKLPRNQRYTPTFSAYQFNTCMWLYGIDKRHYSDIRGNCSVFEPLCYFNALLFDILLSKFVTDFSNTHLPIIKKKNVVMFTCYVTWQQAFKPTNNSINAFRFVPLQFLSMFSRIRTHHQIPIYGIFSNRANRELWKF